MARGRYRYRLPARALVSIALVSTAALEDSSAQERIGRLFSSPEQRLELDRLRNEAGVEGEGTADGTEDGAHDARSPDVRVEPERSPEPEGRPPALAVTFNGIVVRSDGRHVAWVDGVETLAGATTPSGVRIEADRAPGGRPRIRVSDGRTSALLAPGQSIDETGGVRDVYERRAGRLVAGTSGEHPEGSDGGEAGEGVAVTVASPEPISLPSLPASLVWEMLREVRSDVPASGDGESGPLPAGGG